MKRILVPGIVSRRPVSALFSIRTPTSTPFSLWSSPPTRRTFWQYSSSSYSHKSKLYIHNKNTNQVDNHTGGTRRTTMSVVVSSPPPTSVVFMSTSTSPNTSSNSSNSSNNKNHHHDSGNHNTNDSSSSLYQNNATRILPLPLTEEDPSKQEERILEIVYKFCPFLWNDQQLDNDEEEEEQSSLVMSSCCSSSSSSLTVEEEQDHPPDTTIMPDDHFSSPDKPHQTTPEKRMKNYPPPYPSSPQHDSSSHLTIRPLGGGLSNVLFVVSNIKDERQSVLVRIHPDDHDNDHDTPTLENNNSTSSSNHELIDRHVENQVVAWLSSQGKAPLYYGRFTNGRVEEFYHGYHPMTCHDMVQYTSSIAIHMAQYHQLQVPSTLFVQNEKNGECHHHHNTTTTTQFQGHIWNRIETWFQMIGTTTTTTTTTNSKHSSENSLLVEDVPTLLEEFKWLQHELTTKNKYESNDDDNTNILLIKKYAVEFCREIVFTHGDLQSLNILKTQDSQEEEEKKNDDNHEHDHHAIKIIDFEYAGMNPRGVDIANTFCEYCDMNNLQADYENEYPSEHIQNLFLRQYVQETLKHNIQDDNNNDDVEPTASFSWLQTVFRPHNEEDTNTHTQSSPDEREELFLTALRQEVGKYSLVSHLGWTVWSLVQHQISTIDFDYLAYGKHRMEGYRYFKPLFFPDNGEQLHQE